MVIQSNCFVYPSIYWERGGVGRREGMGKDEEGKGRWKRMQ